MRILGLDIGSKRIGVAISDELGITAQGLDSLICKNPREDVKRIVSLVKERGVTEIVVGMPYNMNGTEGPQALKVRAMMALISQKLDIPVKDWDERLSTVAAERALLEADMSREKRRKVIDKLSAVIILQGYLDRRRYEDIPIS